MGKKVTRLTITKRINNAHDDIDFVVLRNKLPENKILYSF